MVNRGFVATLLLLVVAAELLLRAAAGASPATVRIVYGSTLAMYMEIDKRLRDAAPEVQVLAIGDSLTMTQFQPDTFVADHHLPARAVFNASLLAETFRSHESLLRHVGLDRFTALRRVMVFVNPRRLTPEGNVDAAVFRVAIPDRDGTWNEAWRERSVSPVFDRSRLYGLSRYLLSASWRQIGRPDTWDQVEYLMPTGGIAYEHSRQTMAGVAYPYGLLEVVNEEYVSDLSRLIQMLRARNIEVVTLPPAHHHNVQPFASGVEARFYARMRALADQTGAAWVPLPLDAFKPPSDLDFMDYGHLTRSGGIAYTHWLRDAVPGS
jgi:hypothetical protein